MEKNEKNRRQHFVSKLVILAGALVCLAGIGLGIVFLVMDRFADTPMQAAGAPRVLLVKPGDSLTAIARRLEQEHLVASRHLFRLFTRIQGDAKKLKAGEYGLSGEMTPREILDIIVSGRTVLYRLTIPEGLTMDETAGLVESAGLGDKGNFSSLCRDSGLIRSLGIPADTAEGYLFPDTYFFPRTATPRDIITTMIRRFNEIYSQAWIQRQNELGFTRHQIVILASIIEKETGDASERPLIGSVFHNRLKMHMRLESDPTVIYGIPDFDGNITRKHLRQVTPYNTYVIPGLPKGPIANPGARSIEAALFPASTDFIFFVSKQDTTHHFSTTFKEHNQAVRKYQLGR